MLYGNHIEKYTLTFIMEHKEHYNEEFDNNTFSINPIIKKIMQYNIIQIDEIQMLMFSILNIF